MTGIDVPPERDLPAGRLSVLKEDLMVQIEHDSEPTSPHRWRRVGLAAAALAGVLALAGTVVLEGDDTASANTAVRNDDGSILITFNESKHPKDLERRLNDLGMPAVVDFLESGWGCDPSRSTGWVQEPRGEELIAHADTTDGTGGGQLVLHPDALEPGETAVFEFQLDEYRGRIAASVMTRVSTSEVGPCERVRNASIVDAEHGIAGG